MNTDEEGFIFEGALKRNKIHISIINRNKKKAITFVEGLELTTDFKKLLKTMKTSFNCNGNLVIEESKVIIQIQGDKRNDVRDLLIKEGLSNKDDIVMHGY